MKYEFEEDRNRIDDDEIQEEPEPGYLIYLFLNK